MGIFNWLLPEGKRKERKHEPPKSRQESKPRRPKADPERERRANLLLEYEELLARRKELGEELNADSENLLEFLNLIDHLGDGYYDEKLAKLGERGDLGRFDVSRAPDCKEILKRGLEYEQVVIKIHIMKRKLGLLRMWNNVLEREKDGEKE